MGKLDGLKDWCGRQVIGYGLTVDNFSTAFNDGLVLCAILHRYFPADIPWKKLSGDTPAARAKNFELAFSVSEKRLGVLRLLDVEDMERMYPKPDFKSVALYVSQVANALQSRQPSGTPPQAASSGSGGGSGGSGGGGGGGGSSGGGGGRGTAQPQSKQPSGAPPRAPPPAARSGLGGGGGGSGGGGGGGGRGTAQPQSKQPSGAPPRAPPRAPPQAARSGLGGSGGGSGGGGGGGGRGTAQPQSKQPSGAPPQAARSGLGGGSSGGGGGKKTANPKPSQPAGNAHALVHVQVDGFGDELDDEIEAPGCCGFFRGWRRRRKAADREKRDMLAASRGPPSVAVGDAVTTPRGPGQVVARSGMRVRVAHKGGTVNWVDLKDCNLK
jgi:hypothetical protein